MPKPPKPRWHKRDGRWCSDVGPPRTPGGRASTLYFPREIGRYDKPQVAGIPKAAWDWLAAYLRDNPRKRHRPFGRPRKPLPAIESNGERWGTYRETSEASGLPLAVVVGLVIAGLIRASRTTRQRIGGGVVRCNVPDAVSIAERCRAEAEGWMLIEDAMKAIGTRRQAGFRITAERFGIRSRGDFPLWPGRTLYNRDDVERVAADRAGNVEEWVSREVGAALAGIGEHRFLHLVESGAIRTKTPISRTVRVRSGLRFNADDCRNAATITHPKRGRPLGYRVSRGVDGEALKKALASMPDVAPPVPELARVLGWDDARTRKAVDNLERRGDVETWTDGDDRRSMRVMLSARVAKALGLVLDRSGNRWVSAVAPSPRPRSRPTARAFASGRGPL